MFKLVLLVLVVVAVLWMMRGKAPQVPPARPQGRPADPPAQPILACAQCGLHMPQGEALPGRGGVFCSEAHRAEYERAHPTA